MRVPSYRRNKATNQAGRLVAMFGWAVQEEMIPPHVPQALWKVKPLKKGRTAAKETPKVPPAPDEDILAARECMPDELSDMIQLQLLMACRPGELRVIRPGDIDRNSDVWLYRPAKHKNDYRDQDRIIGVGHSKST